MTFIEMQKGHIENLTVRCIKMCLATKLSYFMIFRLLTAALQLYFDILGKIITISNCYIKRINNSLCPLY